jgi:hypothetical protein
MAQRTLGILGARNSITKQIIQDEILNPILNDLGKAPIKILAPSESMSSTYIECWAQRQSIPVELVKSDWIQNGRRAGIIRDAEIEKQCNALLIFEGPKSRYYLDLAERIAKRRPGYLIYVVEAKGVSPVLLEVEQGVQYAIKDDEEADILKQTPMQTQTLKQMWSKCLIQDD